MLSSITPLGERGRAGRWGITVTAYAAGSAAGGAAVGALAGALGWLLPLELGGAARVVLVLLALAAAAAVLVETGVLPHLPTVHRQVDEDWLHRYRGWVYGAGFGFQLGTGVVTIVTSPTVYVTGVLAVLTGSPIRGAAVGLAFGLTRALPVVLARRVTTTATLAATSRRLVALEPAGQRVAAASLAAVAMAGVAQLVLGGGSS
jgi:MFS family permease